MKLRTKALAGLAAASLALLSSSAFAEPKVLMLHQWAAGNDAASIAKLGEMFTAAGGTWEQTAIAGHTANTLAKLRADVVAGNAPAAVQLKGPEIAEWNADRRDGQHGRARRSRRLGQPSSPPSSCR